MSESKTLYDTDFFAWSTQQAEALRSAARDGSNRPLDRALDWENLAEEIESLGKSDRRELFSQTRRIIHHLLKFEHSPAAPRAGWAASIADARNQIETVIEDSPSLRKELATIVAVELRRGARNAIADLEEHGELDTATRARIQTTAYTPEQI